MMIGMLSIGCISASTIVATGISAANEHYIPQANTFSCNTPQASKTPNTQIILQHNLNLANVAFKIVNIQVIA